MSAGVHSPLACPACGSDRIQVSNFGLIFLIRTGPADYSHWLVTEARRRGFHVVGGRLHKGLGVPGRDDCTCDRIATPTEAYVYSALGLPYAEPWERAL